MAKQYTAEERSRNAQKQLRDRLGKFIPMGGKVSWVSKGKKKTGNVLGNDGVYLYLLPPIKNATHRPEPYRIPLSAVQVTNIDAKASLKSKKDRDAEKKAVNESIKDFESKLTPEQVKNVDRIKEVSAKLKKEKKDVDFFEDEKDGTTKLGKRERKEADEKTVATVEKLMQQTSDEKNSELPLQDGMKVEFSRKDGKIITTIKDRDGDVIQRSYYSEGRGEAGPAQQSANEIQSFLDAYESTEEAIIDLDGDGIPDDRDPRINVEVSTPDPKPKKYSKDELDLSKKGATLTEGEGNKVLYVKSNLRDEERGYRWERYERAPSGAYEKQGHVYPDDLENADLKSARVKEKKVDTESKPKAPSNKNELGIRGLDKRLANTISVPYKEEKQGARRWLRLEGKPDLDKLPLGTSIQHKSPTGKSAEMVKIGKDLWYGKAGSFSNDEFLEKLTDTPAILANADTSRKKNLDAKLKSYRAKNNIPDEESRQDIYKEIEETNSREAISFEDLLKDQIASDDDPVNTKYELQSENTVYIKQADGRIVNSIDSEDYFDNAAEFHELFTQQPEKIEGTNKIDPKTVGRADYYKFRPEDVADSAGDISDLTAIEPKQGTKNGPMNRVATNVPEAEVTKIELTNGDEINASSTFDGRTKQISSLVKRGLLEHDDPRIISYLYQNPVGTESDDSFYFDGSAMKIGDRVFVPYGRVWNNDPDTKFEDREIAYHEHVIVGFSSSSASGDSSGKGDVLTFPLGEQEVRVRQANNKEYNKVHGSEEVTQKTRAVRSNNVDKILSEGDDGKFHKGQRHIENTSGRVGSHSLGQFYGADGKELFAGDKIKFRHERQKESIYDENGNFVGLGAPFSKVMDGEIIGFNEKNQSIRVRAYTDDGVAVTLEPSIKYTTKEVTPPSPSDYRTGNNLPELPEGFIRDNQNRVIDPQGQRISENYEQSRPKDGGRTVVEQYDPAYAEELFGESEDDSSSSPEEIFGEEEKPAPAETETETETETPTVEEQKEKRKKNLINSAVETSKEYTTDIPRYFRDRREKEYSSDREKAKDWANAPVGSAIRVKGGTFAIKTGDNTWDFRKSSKHLVQRNLSTNQMAKILEESPEILENGRASAPTRKKFLEYNGGRVKPTKAPSSQKAPEGSQVEVEGETVTKASGGWETEQGTLLNDNQMDTLLANNPEDVKIKKVSVGKVTREGQRKVAAQDTLFDMNDDGTVSVTPGIYTDEKTYQISSEEADTLFGSLSESFDATTTGKQSDGIESLTLDDSGNISPEIDPEPSATANTAVSRMSEIASVEKPRRIINDNSDYFQTAKVFSKPNPDGGYDLIINSDGATEDEMAVALFDGIRKDVAKAHGLAPLEMDQRVVRNVYSAKVNPEHSKSKSYDEILQELGIRSKRQGSAVREAFEDVWTNGSNASPIHIDIWKDYASNSELLALFRHENGRDPQSQEELLKFKKGL